MPHLPEDTDLHAQSYAVAESIIAGIADDEDRRIVRQTFDQVPAP